jgi:hypothetical protein
VIASASELRVAVARWTARIESAQARYRDVLETSSQPMRTRLLYADPHIEVWLSRWGNGAAASVRNGPVALGVIRGVLTEERWDRGELWAIRKMSGGRIALLEHGELTNAGNEEAWMVHAAPAGRATLHNRSESLAVRGAQVRFARSIDAASGRV